AMASREGTVVLLEDLVREATSRALTIVRGKNPELTGEQQLAIAQAVALGSIRYSMISRENTKVVTFDWETALNFDGQAAPYVQYAYVRAGSILRKWGKDVPHSTALAYELSPAEVQLVELISRLPREIQTAAGDYRPMVLSNLAYELAKAFNDFYNQCPVLQAEPAVRDGRLLLVTAARQAIANVLNVLGVIAPQAM
ncbi:arginine--tRNA ligase, partial [bacterium]